MVRGVVKMLALLLTSLLTTHSLAHTWQEVGEGSGGPGQWTEVVCDEGDGWQKCEQGGGKYVFSYQYFPGPNYFVGHVIEYSDDYVLKNDAEYRSRYDIRTGAYSNIISYNYTSQNGAVIRLVGLTYSQGDCLNTTTFAFDPSCMTDVAIRPHVSTGSIANAQEVCASISYSNTYIIGDSTLAGYRDSYYKCDSRMLNGPVSWYNNFPYGYQLNLSAARNNSLIITNSAIKLQSRDDPSTCFVLADNRPMVQKLANYGTNTSNGSEGSIAMRYFVERVAC